MITTKLILESFSTVSKILRVHVSRRESSLNSENGKCSPSPRERWYKAFFNIHTGRNKTGIGEYGILENRSAGDFD